MHVLLRTDYLAGPRHTDHGLPMEMLERYCAKRGCHLRNVRICASQRCAMLGQVGHAAFGIRNVCSSV